MNQEIYITFGSEVTQVIAGTTNDYDQFTHAR